MSALRPAAHKSLTTLILSLREQLFPIAHTSISHTLGSLNEKKKKQYEINRTIGNKKHESLGQVQHKTCSAFAQK